MKKLIIFLFVFLPILTLANDEDETELVKTIRTFYDGLDHSAMKTDYLFNRGFVILNDLEEWYNGSPIITNRGKWECILKCINESKITSSQKDIINLDFPGDDNNTSTVNLSVLNYMGDYISNDDVKKHLEDNTPVHYRPLTLFAGNVMQQKVYSGNVQFEWDPACYFSNNKHKGLLYINFSDQQGFVPIDISRKQTINVEYDCIGEKSICFKQIQGSDTLISYSKINIKILCGEMILKSAAIINSASAVNFSVNGLNYKYEVGVDNKLDKPVIISEGFDILDNLDADHLQYYWESRMDVLKDHGYDIFYIDYDDPGLSLQENASCVVDLVHQINNNKTGNYEGIYIGESMGGIIGRIALKSMENNGYDHQIGLFVPYDSPFKGAYIPEGIQWTLADLYANAGNLVLLSFIVSIFDGLFDAEVPSMTFLMSQMNSTAARQMLARHYTGTSTHNTFRSYLDNLGYPALSRNVAIVNGSNNATYQGMPAVPGDTIYSHDLSLGLVDYRASAWYTSATQSIVAKTGVLELLPLPHWSVTGHSVGAGSQLFTNAPGSYIEANYDEYGYSGHVKFTFVPTLSAIDISNSIFDSGDFDYFNNNEDAIIANGLTPFDDIYIDSTNSGHTYRETFFNYEYFKKHEIMYKEMYLQNRTLNYDRDFEASETITVGSNTQPWGTDKHQDTGDFIISSGTTVNMEAGQSIILKSGFMLCDGATFKMSVTPGDPTLKSSKVQDLPAPVIIGNKYVEPDDQFIVQSLPDDGDVSWQIIGNNYEYQDLTDEFLIPNGLQNGQYTLVARINTNGQESSASKVIIFQKSTTIGPAINNTDDINITVYPNPTDDRITIDFSQINLNNIELEIKDILGKTVMKEININTNKVEINTSALSKGVYFIHIINDGRNVEAKKFVKL